MTSVFLFFLCLFLVGGLGLFFWCFVSFLFGGACWPLPPFFVFSGFVGGVVFVSLGGPKFLLLSPNPIPV